MAGEFNYGPRMKIAGIHYQQTHDKNSESGTDNTNDSVITTTSSEGCVRGLSSTTSHSLGSHWKHVATVQNSSVSDSSATVVDTSDATCIDSIGGSVIMGDLKEQDEQIVNLLTMIKKCRRTFRNAFRDKTNAFVDSCKEGDELQSKILEKLDELENDHDDFESVLIGDVEDFIDIAQEFAEFIENKEKVERYMEDGAERVKNFDDIAMLIESNFGKSEKIRELVNRTRIEHAPLTIFEHDDTRVHEVISSLATWIKSLPLSRAELDSIEKVFSDAELNNQYDGRYKCEVVFRHLLTVMSNWGVNPEHTLLETRNIPWQTLRTTAIPNQSSNVFESSSYALSDLNDSILSDLDQLVADAKIQTAVEGPKRCIEIGTWSSVSRNNSLNTDGHSSVQTVGEEMSLSSYELQSSASYTSVSRISMPDFLDEDRLLKTALSPGERVDPQPLRSTTRLANEDCDADVMVTSSVSDAPLSTRSLSEMILQTARGSAFSSAGNLLSALQESANKCGVAVSNLLTNSSSSASESNTQASNSRSLTS